MVLKGRSSCGSPLCGLCRLVTVQLFSVSVSQRVLGSPEGYGWAVHWAQARPPLCLGYHSPCRGGSAPQLLELKPRRSVRAAGEGGAGHCWVRNSIRLLKWRKKKLHTTKNTLLKQEHFDGEIKSFTRWAKPKFSITSQLYSKCRILGRKEKSHN